MSPTRYTWSDLKPYPKLDGSQVCASIGIEPYFVGERQSHESHARDALDLLRLSCQECPFLTECRDWAIHHEYYGFWGGMTQRERTVYRKENNIEYIAPEWVEGYYV